VLSGEVTDERPAGRCRRSVACDLAAQAGTGRQLSEVMNTYADVAAGHASYATLPASAATYAQLVQVVGTTSSSSPDPLVPGAAAADALNPYGNELRLWRGVIVQREIPEARTPVSPDGSRPTRRLSAAHTTYGEVAQSETLTTVDEQVPLGVFVITEFDATDDGGAIKLTVRGEDRARRISRTPVDRPVPGDRGDARRGRHRGASAGPVEQRGDRHLHDQHGDGRRGRVRSGGRQRPVGGRTPRLAKAAGLDLFFDAEGRAVIAGRAKRRGTPAPT